MDSRARGYKAGSKSVSEIRSRRNDVTVELRKSKKEDQMNKRRNIDVNATSPIKEPNSPISDDRQPLFGSLEEVVAQMKSNDPANVFRATQAARKILSQERNPPIDALIHQGIVPICIKFLDSPKWVIFYRYFFFICFVYIFDSNFIAFTLIDDICSWS